MNTLRFAGAGHACLEVATEGLRRRVRDYPGTSDATARLISPLFADLTGLPPLLANRDFLLPILTP